MEIELRHLRLVRAIADAGSVTRAAATLGSSQPAVTRSLRRIEDALGGPLFARSRGGVEPTPLGRLVVNRARAILPAVESLQADVEAARTPGDGPQRVRVGAATGPTMMGLLQGLAAHLPGTTVASESEQRIDALATLVEAGRVDVAVVHAFAGSELTLGPSVEQLPIATHPVFVMLPEHHRLAAAEEVALADLADERWVLSPLDVDREYDVVAAACDDAGFAPKVEHYLSGSPAVEFVRSGGLVGLCFPTARFSGIATRPIVGSPIRVRQLLAVHRRSPLAPYAAQLVRAVSDELDLVAQAVPSYRSWLDRHGRLPAGSHPAAALPTRDAATG